MIYVHVSAAFFNHLTNGQRSVQLCMYCPLFFLSHSTLHISFSVASKCRFNMLFCLRGRWDRESKEREREREREIARERVKERAGKHNWQGTLKASSSIMRCLIWQCTGFPVEWAYEYNYLYSPKSFFGLPLYNSYLD